MKNRRAVVIVLIIVAALIGGYYGVQALNGGTNGALKASGTIEAVTVNVSPELAGKVQEVYVDEGQNVKQGDPLFRLDDTLLKVQQAAAEAGLGQARSAAETAQAAYASAQAAYDIAQNSALSQDRAKRTQDWFVSSQSDFLQPNWYYTQSEQVAAAQSAVEAAQQALAEKEAQLEKVQADTSGAEFVNAEKEMAIAQANYLAAKQMNDLVSNGKDITDLSRRGLFELARDTIFTNKGVDPKWIGNNLDVELRIASQTTFDEARARLKASQKAYLDLIGSQGAADVLKARADVSVAQEHYYRVEDLLRSLQTGGNSPELTAAEKALDQAKSGAQQAQDAVAQAQANLDLLNAQLGKLEVKAPQAGVILTRNIEPGEYVQPGAAALSMANITALTITVYVPEDRYGQISLGQGASMSVDSFPGEQFRAQVSTISDQAEFTPRNVQTVEGRSSTVYAVKLKVVDPQGKLKPGMPADVVFNTK